MPSIMETLNVRITEDAGVEFCREGIHKLQDLITSASTSLHSTTGLTISTVAIEVPISFSSSPSCSSLLSVAPPLPSPPSILVSNLPLLPGPFPVQFDGCGEPGLHLSLPTQWILSSTTNTTKSLGNTLSTALIQTKFGTFTTHGIQGSKRFPEMYNLGEEEVTNCGDSDVYDTEAPTAQNLLCHEQSPIQIVHTKLGSWEPQSGLPAPLPPTFHLWTPNSCSTLYILLLDQSKHMETNRRWRNLHNALALFLQDLPDGDEVAVITFDRSAKVKLSPVSLTSSNRAGVHGRIPGKSGIQDEVCLDCAVRKAREMAKGREQEAKTILVTAAGSSKDPIQHGLSSSLAVILMGETANNPFTSLDHTQIYSVKESETNTNEDIYDLLSLIRAGSTHK